MQKCTCKNVHAKTVDAKCRCERERCEERVRERERHTARDSDRKRDSKRRERDQRESD